MFNVVRSLTFFSLWLVHLCGRWSSQVFNWPLSALIKLSRIHADYGDSSGPLRTMHWEITEDKIIK